MNLLFMVSLWSKSFVEKKVWILLYLAIIGRKKRHFWMNPLLSGKKVALGVPFEYDNFTNFFSNRHIWCFSLFILTCDMKLDLSEHFRVRKVVPGVPFDYDDFANFFANSCIWRFSGILVAKKSHLVSPSKMTIFKTWHPFLLLGQKNWIKCVKSNWFFIGHTQPIKA